MSSSVTDPLFHLLEVTDTATFNNVIVTGTTSYSSFDVTGDVTIGGTLTVDDNTVLNSNLTVIGTSNLDAINAMDNVFIGAGLDVTGDTTIGAAGAPTETLTVHGAVVVDETLDVTGSTTLTDITADKFILSSTVGAGLLDLGWHASVSGLVPSGTVVWGTENNPTTWSTFNVAMTELSLNEPGFYLMYVSYTVSQTPSANVETSFTINFDGGDETRITSTVTTTQSSPDGQYYMFPATVFSATPGSPVPVTVFLDKDSSPATDLEVNMNWFIFKLF